MTEGRILLLKARQRRLGLPSRNGWLGDAQRLLETWLATEVTLTLALTLTLTLTRTRTRTLTLTLTLPYPHPYPYP